MPADTKKAQSLINAAAQEAEKIQAASLRLGALLSRYQSENVSPIGTALNGNAARLTAWINQVQTVAEAQIVTEIIAANVPSHRGEAL